MHLDVIFPEITSTLQITGCHFGVKPTGWDYPNHHHHLYELLYCQQEGATKLLINGFSLALNKGDWLFIKAGVRHQMENYSQGNDHFSFFNIHFDIDDQEMRKSLSASNYELYPASIIASTKLPEHMEEIEEIMYGSLLNNPLHKSITERRLSLSYENKIRLQAYILLIIQEIIHIQPKKPMKSTHSIDRKQVATLYQTDTAHAIEEQLQRIAFSDGSIEHIANKLNLSRSQCSKIFTKVYGISPRQYTTQLKLNRAKKLLVSTNRSVEDIAYELGFNSSSHFCRQFRHGTGMSPNQFRPKHMI